MDLLKRSIRKSVPNLSNLSKISHESEISSQGVLGGGGGGGSTEPREPPLNPLLSTEYYAQVFLVRNQCNVNKVSCLRTQHFLLGAVISLRCPHEKKRWLFKSVQ